MMTFGTRNHRNA